MFLLELGFIRTEKNIFRTYLGANVNLAIQEFGISSIIAEGLLNFTWLKGLKQTNKNKFFVGGELEAGLLFRNTSGLGNNSLSFLFNNTLSGTARIERPLPNTRWTLGGELSLGLISWVRNSSGYAFSTPQAFLTNGEFNYDDDVIFKFYKYGKIEPIGKFHRMKTNISFIQNRERISWGGIYNWRMKAYDPYESGQIVQGTHLIKFYFGFNFGVRKNRMK